MAHIRKLIRDQIVSQITGLATTAGRVYPSRVYPMGVNKLPGIVVYTDSESADYATVSLPRTVIRTLSVNLEIYVKGVANYDDDIDQITAEIEAAIYSDTTLGGYAKDARITNYVVQYLGEGDQPVGTAILSLEVIYTTTEGSPTS
jgi:hypothetical protein